MTFKKQLIRGIIIMLLINQKSKMSKFTKDLLEASKDFLKNSKGSFLRTLIYTIGHFIIAITCLMLLADVSFLIALTDAIIEPLANSIWYFILDKWWTRKNKSQ